MPSGSSVREGGESDGGEPPSEVTDASPMDTGKSRDCSRVVCLVVAVSDRGMSLMEGNHPLITDASPMDTGRSRDCSRVMCLVVAVSEKGVSLMEGNHPLRSQMPHLWTQVSPEIVAGLCAQW